MKIRKNDTIYYCPNTNCDKSYSRLEYVRRHAKSTHNCDIDPETVRKVPRDTHHELPSVTSPNAKIGSFPGNAQRTNLDTPPQHLDAGDTTMYDPGSKQNRSYVNVTVPLTRGPSRITMRHEVPLPARSQHTHTIPRLTSTGAEDDLINSLQTKLMEQQIEISQMRNELTRLRTSVSSVCDVISQSLRSFSDWNA